MKKIFVSAAAILFACSTATFAQETVGKEIKKDAGKAGHAIKKGAKKVGQKSAEWGAKGAAKITDKKYEGKTAPNGNAVYITDDGQYYWVDKKGKRHFVKEEQLKPKS
jgi:hypothetical protein